MSTSLGWPQFATRTLDVEYAHAIAPGANILLVATPQSETEGVQGLPQIVATEIYVLNHNPGPTSVANGLVDVTSGDNSFPVGEPKRRRSRSCGRLQPELI